MIILLLYTSMLHAQYIWIEYALHVQYADALEHMKLSVGGGCGGARKRRRAECERTGEDNIKTTVECTKHLRRQWQGWGVRGVKHKRNPRARIPHSQALASVQVTCGWCKRTVRTPKARAKSANCRGVWLQMRQCCLLHFWLIFYLRCQSIQ